VPPAPSSECNKSLREPQPTNPSPHNKTSPARYLRDTQEMDST
jgi:hypothetical protein